MATERDLRRLALALPETAEKLCYGTPGFYVRGKLFARLLETPGVVMLRVPDEQDKTALITERPAAFFTTPHYDGFAGVLLRLKEVRVAELRELVLDAWSTRAPKALLPEGVRDA